MCTSLITLITLLFQLRSPLQLSDLFLVEHAFLLGEERGFHMHLDNFLDTLSTYFSAQIVPNMRLLLNWT